MIFNLKDPDYVPQVSKQDIIDVVTGAAEWMNDLHVLLSPDMMEINLMQQERLIDFLEKLE